MKVAILAPYWNPPSFRGGISRVIYELRQIWIQQGHTVHVFASNTFTDREEGIFKCPIPAMPLRGVWNSLYYRMTKTFEQYDIVFPQTIIECMFLHKWNCIPFVHTLSKIEHKVPWRFWRYSHQFLETMAFRGIKACITLTQDTEDTISKKFNINQVNVVRVNNGVDSNKFRPGVKGIEEKPFTVFSAGRFIPRKRFDLLIRSFGIFCKNHEEVKLTIAGDGYLGDELRALVGSLNIQDKVDFVGLVDENKMIELYQSAAVFVLPSISEGMPMVVLEAQSSGLPVIIGNFESAEQVIDENRTGFILRTADPEDWQERLSVLYHDTELRQQFGTAARKRVISLFGWDSIAEQIMAQFGTILKSHKAKAF